MTRIVVALIMLCWAPAVWAQSALSADANRAVQITEERQKNAALMRHYTWMSRTEILKDGQIKDNRLEMCNYDPFGRLQRNLMNDQSAPLPFGFLRRAIAGNERQEMEQYLTGLRGLIDQYTLPSTGKILDFMMSSKPMGPDASGLFSLTGNNVIQPGDNLTIWVNAMTKHVARVQVSTAFQGNPVTLSATFNTLPSGLNYMSFAEVTVPSKQLSVQVQNFDYNRTN
jgi:hypothetical protein